MVQNSSLHTKEWLSYTESGREIVRRRSERIKHIDDDLPKVVKAYQVYKEGKL